MTRRRLSAPRLALLFAAFFVAAPSPAPAQSFDVEQPPIEYSSVEPDDPISRLGAKLESGEVKLTFDPKQGYLPSVLKSLDISPKSQVLVFSKTSMQREHISPEHPRALYFNDDVYVGWTKTGDKIEFSAADALLGANFYTLPQEQEKPPRFAREMQLCSQCHLTRTIHQGVPGHLIRSVSTQPNGIADQIVFRTVDHTTPIAERWGGWYITGRYNGQPHMGNRPGESEPSGAADATDVSLFVNTADYLTPYSDLIALMVLEHQVEGHNRISRANMLTRKALFDDAESNESADDSKPALPAKTVKRIRDACEPLVEYLLFTGEAPLNGPTTGTSGFVDEFAGRGPKTRDGRSLRDFDLKSRLFRFPLSYLVYTQSFAELPTPARDYVLKRFHAVLTGKDESEKFAHLSPGDRQAILEIVRETLPNLPDEWKP